MWVIERPAGRLPLTSAPLWPKPCAASSSAPTFPPLSAASKRWSPCTPPQQQSSPLGSRRIFLKVSQCLPSLWLIKSVFAPPTHSIGLIRKSSAAPGSLASSLTRPLSYASSPHSSPRSLKIRRPKKLTSTWTPPTRPRPDAR